MSGTIALRVNEDESVTIPPGVRKRLSPGMVLIVEGQDKERAFCCGLAFPTIHPAIQARRIKVPG